MVKATDCTVRMGYLALNYADWGSFGKMRSRRRPADILPLGSVVRGAVVALHKNSFFVGGVSDADTVRQRIPD